MADFDFRTRREVPNFQLPPEVMQLLAQAVQQKNQMYAGLGQDLGKGITAGIEGFQKGRQEKKFNQARQQFVQQNPNLAGVSQFMTQDNVGQILPGLMKQNQPKPQGELWRNTSTGETSLEEKPGFKRVEGITPQQAQTDYSQGIAASARKTWAEQIKNRTDMGYVQNIYNDLNTLDKGSGGVLGQAATIQYRAQRLQHFLQTPGLVQDASIYKLIQSDVAALAQGGAPTMAAQSEANNPTFAQEANAFLRRITKNPKEVDQPQIKKQLLKLAQVFGASSKSIFDQNTSGLRELYSTTDWFKQNPGVFDQAAQYLGHGIKPFDTKNLPPIGPAPTDVPSYQDTTPVDQ